MSMYPHPGDNNLMVTLFSGAPLPLHWWGWETTTHILHREGWQLLAEESRDDIYDGWRIRIGAKSPDNAILITGVANLDYRHLHEYGGRGVVEHLFHRGGMKMQQWSSRDKVAILPHSEIESMHAMMPFDPYEPVARRMGDISYRGLNVFNYEWQAPKEIYVPANSVSECLDRILQLQYPEQQAIKKLVGIEKKPIIEARILSLAA